MWRNVLGGNWNWIRRMYGTKNVTENVLGGDWNGVRKMFEEVTRCAVAQQWANSIYLCGADGHIRVNVRFASIYIYIYCVRTTLKFVCHIERTSLASCQQPLKYIISCKYYSINLRIEIRDNWPITKK